jgi:hypothetical protein
MFVSSAEARETRSIKPGTAIKDLTRMYRWSIIYGITSITLFISKINKEKISTPSRE